MKNAPAKDFIFVMVIGITILGFGLATIYLLEEKGRTDTIIATLQHPVEKFVQIDGSVFTESTVPVDCMTTTHWVETGTNENSKNNNKIIWLYSRGKGVVPIGTTIEVPPGLYIRNADPRCWGKGCVFKLNDDEGPVYPNCTTIERSFEIEKVDPGDHIIHVYFTPYQGFPQAVSVYNVKP